MAPSNSPAARGRQGLRRLTEAVDCRTHVLLDRPIPSSLQRLRTQSRDERGHDLRRHDQPDVTPTRTANTHLKTDRRAAMHSCGPCHSGNGRIGACGARQSAAPSRRCFGLPDFHWRNSILSALRSSFTMRASYTVSTMVPHNRSTFSPRQGL
jgi:hypothetical protein